MKIDAHQHFWEYSSGEYPWIDEKMPVLKRDYLPDNLLPELKACDFEGCIAVQARQMYGENLFLTGLAEENPFIKGVVGWVDLRSPEIEKQLGALVKIPYVCGVRHLVQDEPEDDFLLNPDFLRGISFLKDYNLTYDILVYPRHLKVASQFVEKFPEHKFVVDHIAKPDIKRKSPDVVWAEDIKRLAGFPNVYCKLSGMVTETYWHKWNPSDFVPFMDVIFEAFGTHRVMIGSDWPVCRLSAEYPDVIGIVENYIEPFPMEEKEKILGGNAVRFYGLKDNEK